MEPERRSNQYRTRDQGPEFWEKFFQKTMLIFDEIVNDENEEWFVNQEIGGAARNIWKNELRQHFDSLRNYILDKNLTEAEQRKREEKLHSVGLAGDQLKFKMDVFEHWVSKGKKWLSKILAVINSILGSLSSVFPFVEPIKEFKDFLEHSCKLVFCEEKE